MPDVTDATFQRDVLDRSAEVPVVVDLWAEWCGPCRTLGPILERVVGETDGKVALAKIDVDRNPQVSAAFSVQSIPAVFAIAGGKVVDSFIGAVPEAAVREFVARLAPAQSEADRLAALGDEALALLTRIPESAESRRVAALARLGEATTGNGADVERRLEGLLDRVKDDEAARREYVDLLEMLGSDDPRTPQYRRALASRLY